MRTATGWLALPLRDLSLWTGAISALASLFGLRAQVGPPSSKVTTRDPDPGGCA